MNSLKKLGTTGRHAVIALMFIGLLSLTVAAQQTVLQQQGKLYGDPGFKGEPVNLNVVNTDIRDILSYFTEQYGKIA